jgi:hypothetical protein
MYRGENLDDQDVQRMMSAVSLSILRFFINYIFTVYLFDIIILCKFSIILVKLDLL